MIEIRIPTDQYAYINIQVETVEQMKELYPKVKKAWAEIKEAELQDEFNQTKEKHNSKLPLGNKSALAK